MMFNVSDIILYAEDTFLISKIDRKDTDVLYVKIVWLLFRIGLQLLLPT